MPLTPDQQAALQLVLTRGQTYADLSDLLDVSEAEIRERARSALEELGGLDPDRNVPLTDFLLRQADPIARADVVRHLQEDAEDHRLASELVAKLRDLAPEASLPRLPGEPRGGRFLRRTPAGSAVEATEAAAGGGLARRFSPAQSRLFVALGAGAVLLVAAVLAVTGAFGGGNEESPAIAGDPDDEEVTRVALLPQEGGAAGGEAVFGLTGSDTVYLDLDITRLEPPGDEETYVLWLLLTPERGYPLSPLPVGVNGAFRDRLPIPTGLLPVVARVRFVEVTLAPNQRLANLIERAQAQAAEGQDLDDFLLPTAGRTVLRGAIPIEEGPPVEEEPGAPEEDGGQG